jgi:hypothetical protein
MYGSEPSQPAIAAAEAFRRAGLEQLRAAAGERVTTTLHDVREPLPVGDGEVDAVFAHMLLCMALSTQQIRASSHAGSGGSRSGVTTRR